MQDAAFLVPLTIPVQLIQQFITAEILLHSVYSEIRVVCKLPNHIGCKLQSYYILKRPSLGYENVGQIAFHCHLKVKPVICCVGI